MANRIEELQKKQMGYEAAKKAIEETKPKNLATRKSDDSDNSMTVTYEPSGNRFYFERHGNTHKNTLTFNLDVHDVKLMMEALNELLKEA
jgi:hypothetical protein